MKYLWFLVLLVSIGTTACSTENSLVGIWKATSVDMSFAEGRIPPEKMEEAKASILRDRTPAFDLNSDGTARVFGGGKKCNGKWSVQDNIVSVECTNDFIRLEKNGNRLTTLPDRTFTFERQ